VFYGKCTIKNAFKPCLFHPSAAANRLVLEVCRDRSGQKNPRDSCSLISNASNGVELGGYGSPMTQGITPVKPQDCHEVDANLYRSCGAFPGGWLCPVRRHCNRPCPQWYAQTNDWGLRCPHIQQSVRGRCAIFSVKKLWFVLSCPRLMRMYNSSPAIPCKRQDAHAIL